MLHCLPHFTSASLPPAPHFARFLLFHFPLSTAAQFCGWPARPPSDLSTRPSPNFTFCAHPGPLHKLRHSWLATPPRATLQRFFASMPPASTPSHSCFTPSSHCTFLLALPPPLIISLPLLPTIHDCLFAQPPPHVLLTPSLPHHSSCFNPSPILDSSSRSPHFTFLASTTLLLAALQHFLLHSPLSTLHHSCCTPARLSTCSLPPLGHTSGILGFSSRSALLHIFLLHRSPHFTILASASPPLHTLHSACHSSLLHTAQCLACAPPSATLPQLHSPLHSCRRSCFTPSPILASSRPLSTTSHSVLHSLAILEFRPCSTTSRLACCSPTAPLARYTLLLSAPLRPHCTCSWCSSPPPASTLFTPRLLHTSHSCFTPPLQYFTFLASLPHTHSPHFTLSHSCFSPLHTAHSCCTPPPTPPPPSPHFHPPLPHFTFLLHPLPFLLHSPLSTLHILASPPPHSCFTPLSTLHILASLPSLSALHILASLPPLHTAHSCCTPLLILASLPSLSTLRYTSASVAVFPSHYCFPKFLSSSHYRFSKFLLRSHFVPFTLPHILLQRPSHFFPLLPVHFNGHHTSSCTLQRPSHFFLYTSTPFFPVHFNGHHTFSCTLQRPSHFFLYTSTAITLFPVHFNGHHTFSCTLQRPSHFSLSHAQPCPQARFISPALLILPTLPYTSRSPTSSSLNLPPSPPPRFIPAS
ncbi:hypothetical protein C7M84_000143 [Penaeus vannamei]|uniref:Uncharacterized protein n=1 Tax=Penaeus vannamei TaxID=6689 RepID=A0A423TXD9_PENVA|nr:hypothetical protein C7M84_000143 [Penaeus vannamei]